MGSSPEIGDLAPAFDLPGDSGARVRSKDYAGGNLVVYFYPRDDTSGCTREAIDFTARLAEFERARTAIVGISADSPASHDKFKAKHDLRIVLASDERRETIAAYGVWVKKSMYGRKYMGIERATFLIGRDGRIAKVWRKVRLKGHVEDVLKSARALEQPGAEA